MDVFAPEKLGEAVDLLGVVFEEFGRVGIGLGLALEVDTLHASD